MLAKHQLSKELVREACDALVSFCRKRKIKLSEEDLAQVTEAWRIGKEHTLNCRKADSGEPLVIRTLTRGVIRKHREYCGEYKFATVYHDRGIDADSTRMLNYRIHYATDYWVWWP